MGKTKSGRIGWDGEQGGKQGDLASGWLHCYENNCSSGMLIYSVSFLINHIVLHQPVSFKCVCYDLNYMIFQGLPCSQSLFLLARL